MRIPARPGPRTTLHSPEVFAKDMRWKLDYANIRSKTPQEIAALMQEAEDARLLARQVREQTMPNA